MRMQSRQVRDEYSAFLTDGNGRPIGLWITGSWNVGEDEVPEKENGKGRP